MTAWQEASMKLQGSGDRAGQPSIEQRDPWEQAPTPAKVARKVLKNAFDLEVEPEQIGLLTNAMHWGYGTSWGALYGLVQTSAPAPALRRGLLFGTGVWAMSYLTLIPMGLYKPPWEYPATELTLDVSYHLVYGAGLAAGFAALDRP
jgi:hypothetical protein